MMGERKVMKDIGLNEPVSIELPAHVWLEFLASYGTAQWASDSASQVCIKVQEALLDPIYMNERLAEVQNRRDQHDMVFQQFLGGRPDVPPNMEE